MKFTKAHKIFCLTALAVVFSLLWATLYDESFYTYREARLNEKGEIVVTKENYFCIITFLLAMLCLACLFFIIMGQAVLLKRYGLHTEEK